MRTSFALSIQFGLRTAELRSHRSVGTMKRKLSEATEGGSKPARSEAKPRNFDSFGLDNRLLKGIIVQKYAEPTLVQAKAIPAALQGKDIIASSRTGSGKTAAYVLPILQSILRRKPDSSQGNCVQALILVPTRELAAQVTRVIQSLSESCAQEIGVENIARKEDDSVQRARLEARPDIVVSTPGRVAANLRKSALSIENLAHLVIDEADLVLSYDYGGDLDLISQALPTGVQTFLMSATLKSDVLGLKKQFCHDPVVLELEEEERKATKITQYVIRCAEDEKFLLAYAIFKLKLVKGKCIVFVEGIDRCYRLKLFLEQFGIRSCVLNSELPVNSRIHTVEEFNRNVYDIIIASDEHEVMGNESKRPNKKRRRARAKIDGITDAPDVKKDNPIETREPVSDTDHPVGATVENRVGDHEGVNATARTKPRKKLKTTKRDREYGISRGIDFKDVACVLNFDLPTSSKSYTHRIGRTARMGKSGMALSFVIPKDLYHKDKPTSIPSCENDEEVLATITANQEKLGHTIQPYNIDREKLSGFRYRMADALKAVTQLAVRQARTRELRQELLNSEKLKRHFEENPSDLQYLRHDKELRVTRLQHHLRHVPDYLLPNGPRKTAAQDLGFIAKNKPKDNRLRNIRAKNKVNHRGKKPHGRRTDPLKVFTAAVRK